MSRQVGDDDALLQTIAGLRTDVNRLIDEQLTRLNALEQKRPPEPAAERRFSAPASAYQPAPRAPRTPAPAPAPVQAATRVREPVEPPPKPESDDPSQRLDALARHLDGRLRRSGSRAKAEAAEHPESSHDNRNASAREAKR